MSHANALQRAERFIHAEPNTGCWLWAGAKNSQGYGMMRVQWEMKRAHRVVYECMRGPVPKGLMLDHLCRVTLCVNPSHLQAVNNRTNVLRGISPVAVNARKTHCKRGHELAGFNLMVSKRGYRSCRRCKYAANAADRAARRVG